MEVPKRPKPFSMLDKVLDWINVFSLLSVAVLMFVQVILRYVLKMPLMGIEELCYFPTVWLYLFAAVKASSERGQLVARVLEIFCKRQRSIFLLRGIAAFASSAILLWLTWWGYDYLKYALRLQKEATSPSSWLRSGGVRVHVPHELYTLLELRDMITLYRTTPASLPVEKEGD
ncbi:MAG: TRAP transporter small permease [Bilophila wadsworthia]